jgi:hypothetical protein
MAISCSPVIIFWRRLYEADMKPCLFKLWQADSLQWYHWMQTVRCIIWQARTLPCLIKPLKFLLFSCNAFLPDTSTSSCVYFSVPYHCSHLWMLCWSLCIQDRQLQATLHSAIQHPTSHHSVHSRSEVSRSSCWRMVAVLRFDQLTVSLLHMLPYVLLTCLVPVSCNRAFEFPRNLSWQNTLFVRCMDQHVPLISWR